MDDMQRLGGNIELVGFRTIDPASVVVVKKMVGHHVQKLSQRLTNFERLTVTLKQVHQTEQHANAFELHGKLFFNSRGETTSVREHNLFFALDRMLRNLENLSR